VVVEQVELVGILPVVQQVEMAVLDYNILNSLV